MTDNQQLQQLIEAINKLEVRMEVSMQSFSTKLDEGYKCFAEIKRAMAVLENNQKGLLKWKECHKEEHKEEAKNRVSWIWAVMIMLLSTFTGAFIALILKGM